MFVLAILACQLKATHMTQCCNQAQTARYYIYIHIYILFIDIIHSVFDRRRKNNEHVKLATSGTDTPLFVVFCLI